jgi:hypothetical protein
MGHNAIAGVIEMTGANDAALEWHLQCNHYPPVPLSMLPACREAIEAACEGDWDRPIDLPGETSWRGLRFAPAWAVVEGHHLNAFVDDDEED